MTPITAYIQRKTKALGMETMTFRSLAQAKRMLKYYKKEGNELKAKAIELALRYFYKSQSLIESGNFTALESLDEHFQVIAIEE